MEARTPPWTRRLSRRAFLRGGALLLAAPLAGRRSGGALSAGDDTEEPSIAPALRIGLVTDIHYAEKDAAGTRHYREGTAKLREAVDCFNRRRLDFVVELGDLIDAAPSVAEEAKFLEVIERELARLESPRHYVLGNHCVATLTKDEFIERSGAVKPHYSFDAGGFHFVVLDACYRGDMTPYGRNNFQWNDANVPPEEVSWLEEDLERSGRKTIVFVHQRLDVATEYAVKQAAAVRAVLERSTRVLAVFQGHNHVNDYRELGGIHYVTLAAVVEGSGEEANAYSVLDLLPSGAIRIEGFRKHLSRGPLPRSARI